MTIDFDGIEYRILDLPVPAAELSQSRQAGAAGQIFFLRTADDKTALQRFDLKDRKTETLLPDVDEYEISADAKKLLYRVKDAWAIAPRRRRRRSTSSEGKLKMDAIEVRDRSARRVAGDLPRRLAHQPRLLLRPEHARRRLEGDAREVRAVPPAPRRRATT